MRWKTVGLQALESMNRKPEPGWSREELNSAFHFTGELWCALLREADGLIRTRMETVVGTKVRYSSGQRMRTDRVGRCI